MTDRVVYEPEPRYHVQTGEPVETWMSPLNEAPNAAPVEVRWSFDSRFADLDSAQARANVLAEERLRVRVVDTKEVGSW